MSYFRHPRKRRDFEALTDNLFADRFDTSRDRRDEKRHCSLHNVLRVQKPGKCQIQVNLRYDIDRDTRDELLNIVTMLALDELDLQAECEEDEDGEYDAHC